MRSESRILNRPRDKSEALHNFLVDLATASFPTRLSEGLFDKLLAVLEIEMDNVDRAVFVGYVRDDIRDVKEEIARREVADREEALFAENERKRRRLDELAYKKSIWAKIPLWVYFVVIPIIIGVVSGLVELAGR